MVGPVEPLNIGAKVVKERKDGAGVESVGQVKPEVKVGCQYRCSKVFHTGCYSQ